MFKRLYILPICAFLFLLTSNASAQKFKVGINLNVGYGRLYHDTNFETTKLNGLYKFVAISHSDEYTWEEFAERYGVRSEYYQPRFGFSARFNYKEWPLVLLAEAMSSPSSYEKIAFSGTLGLGKDLPIGDNTGIIFSFLGGYKYVYDKGFGSTTLVNSLGNDEARKYAAEWFDPEKPLGTNRGNLFTLRAGFGKMLDEAESMMAGVEAYGELDLTDKVAREGGARMTNAGLNVYFRWNLFAPKDKYLPNPQAAGRRN